MARAEFQRQAALGRIAQQEARIEEQKRLIAILKKNGAATGASERMLITMENALVAMRVSLVLLCHKNHGIIGRT